MEFNSKRWRGAAALVALAIVLLCTAMNIDKVGGILYLAWKFAFPLVLGCCIAFVLNLPMAALERRFFPTSDRRWVKKLRRPLCLTGAMLFVLALFSVVVALVVPEVVDATKLLMQEVPKFLNWAQQWALEHSDAFPAIEDWIKQLSIDWQQLGKNIFDTLSTGAVGVVGGTVAVISGAFNGVVNFIVAFFFALYILLDKEKLTLQCRRMMRAFLPARAEHAALHVSKVSFDIFSRFITGQCTEAAILGSLCAIGMLILQLPYAPMVGAMVAVTALIPVVGAFIGAAVGFFMIMMVSPLKAIIFLIFLMLLQQVENSLIYPKVVGASVGLPALWVMAALTVGGGLGGIIGMLFSVPAASVAYVLIRQKMRLRLKKKESENSSPL